MPTFRTITLGCKVNQYETEHLRRTLLDAGYAPAEKGRPADLCVINTCTVTSEADLKSRKLIRQAARKNPGARVMVMGCYATRVEETVRGIEGVTDVITDKAKLPEWLQSIGISSVASGIDRFGERHRAYVKVQDGCTARCSYCIIPDCRPKLASRPIEAILSEIGELTQNGYREIVLTGIHLGLYGVDETGNTVGPGFGTLLKNVAEMPGDFRVRVSSMHTEELTEEIVELTAGFPRRICPHIHLSLQSGSDEVLRRMNRHYTADEYIEKCRLLQSRVVLPAVTTDVIVGFPGETERDFERTLAVLSAVGFSKVHTFRFSPREGTPAAAMDDAVPSEEKMRRAKAVSRLEAELRAKYFQRIAGIPLQVLVERTCGKVSGRVRGTAARYAPVEMEGDGSEIGRLIEVVPTKVEGGRILAHFANRGCLPPDNTAE